MLDLFDGHSCPPGENCAQPAWLVGRTVDHDHIGQPEIVVDRAEEILQCPNAPRGRPDCTDGRRIRNYGGVRWGLHHTSIIHPSRCNSAGAAAYANPLALLR